MPSSPRISWSAYEHEHVERGRDWYIALGVVAVSIAVICVVFNNVLFGVLIIAAAITLAILAKRPPQFEVIELSDRGIKIGPTMHKYEEIISFWVEDHNTDPPLLLVDTTKFLSPNLIIPVVTVSPAEVRAFLRERIDEVPMKEPVAHKLLEAFGL
jgi:hypothetical protein